MNSSRFIQFCAENTEFLAMLLQDEVARRDQRKFDTLLRQAHFRNHKTLEDFAFDRLPNLNRSLVHDLATGRYLQEQAPVLIVGPCGTGKSHLAQALGHCAIRQGVDVLFITQGDLVGSLHAARATGGFDRRSRQLAKVTLLIIDDFGLKPMRPPHDEDFHDLIAERYERVSTTLAISTFPSGETSSSQPHARDGHVGSTTSRRLSTDPGRR